MGEFSCAEMEDMAAERGFGAGVGEGGGEAREVEVKE